MSCPLATLGGTPRVGIHSYRICDYAVIDIAATVGGAYGISKISGYSFIASLAGLFLLGETMHYLLDIPTKVMEEIGAASKD